jgi:hypothetical protein
MKIQLSTLLFCALIPLTIQAQDTRSDIAVGFKAGMNISNVYDSEGEEFTTDAKTGFAGGVFVHLPIGPIFGVQPELMFSQKGYVSSGSLLGFDYSLTRTSDYIDVPVFFAIKPIESVTLLIGPQYSYLIKQKNVIVTPISNTVVVDEFDNENIRKNTLGLAMGMDLSHNAFVLSGRVAWDLYDNNGDGTSTTPRYKNVTGQVTLGYKF